MSSESTKLRSLEAIFPNLATTQYSRTSNPTRLYNCIAWAAGVNDKWWWPGPKNFGFWPKGVRREETIDAFIEAFATLGYEICPTRDRFEPELEKVAIYTRAGIPTHAARQLQDGMWTSKCGDGIDISHTLEGLASPYYGRATVYLSRRRVESC
ncbi:DUF7689 domain-containing protein [Schlesneria paludicola]